MLLDETGLELRPGVDLTKTVIGRFNVFLNQQRRDEEGVRVVVKAFASAAITRKLVPQFPSHAAEEIAHRVAVLMAVEPAHLAQAWINRSRGQNRFLGAANPVHNGSPVLIGGLLLLLGRRHGLEPDHIAHLAPKPQVQLRCRGILKGLQVNVRLLHRAVVAFKARAFQHWHDAVVERGQGCSRLIGTDR